MKLFANTGENTIPDLLDDPYVAEPCDLPRTTGEVVAAGWRELTASPGRAALVALDAIGLAVLAIALMPVMVRGVDATGPYTARCGVSSYVWGAPGSHLHRACGNAYAGRGLAGAAATIVVVTTSAALALLVHDAGLAALGRSSRERRLVGALTRTPGRAAASTVVVGALVVAAGALRTIALHGTETSGAFVVHCGIGMYLFGSDNPVAQSACRHAYASHARVVALAGITIVGALAVPLVRVVRYGAKEMTR